MKRLLSVFIILLTLVSLCSPSYAAGLFEDLKEYGGNISDVPASHPRVLFTKADIPNIITNSRNSENKEAMKAFNAALLKTTYNVLDEAAEDNANNQVLFSIQAKAFNYAVFGGDTGYDAVNSMIDYLKKYKYPTHDFSALQSYHQVTYTIYNASLVYDWCYDILTTEQEEYLRCELLRLADLEHQFNSLTAGLSPFGGTGTSNYIFRDFLALGIALYDTNPEIFNFINTKINEVYKPIDEYFSKSRSSFYGYQYGAFALYGHTMAYRLMDAVGYEKIFTDDMFHSLDYYMTSRLPDGTNLIEGDDYLRAKGEKHYSMDDSALTMISAAASHYLKDDKFKSYYKDLSLTHTAFWYGTICFTPIDSILLTEAQGIVSDYTLPKSQYFSSPMGMILATNGENENKAVIRMKISEGFKWHHQHYDAGSFEIYYKGRLTGQSAQYSRTDIDQYSNYYVQSIASNTLLIKDPDEIFTYWNSFKEAENSGGQRIKRAGAADLEAWLNNESYNLGKVTGYYSGDDFSYISGDITNAYSDKVSEVKRSMAYVPSGQGGIMFVIDKINSINPSFKKTFLLHSPSEPVITDNTVVISRTDNGYNGRLTLKSLYPETDITGVGGEGKQWYVNGTNYAPWDSYAPELKNDPFAYGWGRIEISPKEERNLDYFVNVIYIDDADSEAVSEAKVINGSNLIGAETDGNAVIYATSSEREDNSLRFKLNSDSDVRILNLTEGYWNVYSSDALISREYATSESGMISFEASAGDINIEYCSDGNYSGGLGTKEAPYVIKTSDDFINIGKRDNNGVYYIQANDINVGEYTPFGFSGNYDGNGKAITVKIKSSEEGTGLFSYLTGNATVEKLSVKGTISGTAYVGGIAGMIKNPVKVTVTNCENYADINASVKGAGGMFGEAYSGTGLSSSTFVIKNLANYGNVYAPFWAGGITGVTKIYHTQMRNSGNVSALGEAGGIVGLNYSTVNESFNNGCVSGSPAGGIAGKIIGGMVENCFNSGDVKITNLNDSGGIVGASDRGTVRYCYDAGYLTTPSEQIIGRIIADKGETTIKSCYYLNPSGKKGLSGSYPLTSEQLKGFSIGSAFEKSKTAYPYPQLSNNSKISDGNKLVKITVSAENAVFYPGCESFYIKKGADVNLYVTCDKYYKLISVSAGDKIAEINNSGTYVFTDVKDNTDISIITEAYTPGVGKTYVYDGDYKKGELSALLSEPVNLNNKYGILLFSSSSGVFKDCGFAVSGDGQNYELISSYNRVSEDYSYGKLFLSESERILYVKPYVSDTKGNIFYGELLNLQLEKIGY